MRGVAKKKTKNNFKKELTRFESARHNGYISIQHKRRSYHGIHFFLAFDFEFGEH